MILTVNNTCDLITVTSENGYIDNIVNASGDQCCHVLELGTNCCEPTLTLPIRTLYNIQYNVTNCYVDTVPNPDDTVMEITISGINRACVETFTYPSRFNPEEITTETNPSDLVFETRFNGIPVTGIIPFEVTLTTCAGLTYSISFNVIAGDLGDICNTLTLGIPTVTYPDLPNGVTINGSNQFEITPEAYGLSTVFPDGIYFVGLSETVAAGQTTAESDSIFVNCDTTCRVIDLLAKDTCSKIYLLLDALRYADDCDTISYQQKCDIWFVVAKELGYFTDNPCGDVEDCGCNK